MTRNFVILVSFLILPAALSCASIPARGSSKPSFTVDAVHTEYGIEVQDLTYVSEGLRVKGLLFTSPVSGKRPALVFNHGGVSGISGDMVRRSADLARGGYMVLTPAYRGEGGSEGVVEVAAGEVSDVLAAAEILRHHPRVDPDRLGLVGSSHGALVSVLAAVRDQRFRAVAAACGVMDVVAWYRYLVDNHFDVSDSLSRAVYGYGPEDKPDAFRVRNATLVASRFHPPLLLQQGMVDKTVPPDQPWRMAQALEQAGHKDHQVLTYSLLGHAFWFWNDLKHHSAEEIEQADQSWKDLLVFLNARLAPGVNGSALPPGSGSMETAPPANPYEAEIRDWQEKRRQRLLADDGWLTVSGLYWLKEGTNVMGSDPAGAVVLSAAEAPRRAGVLQVAGDQVTLHVEPGAPITRDGEPVMSDLILTSDAEGKPDVLALGSLRFYLIKRSKGFGIRIRDLNAPARTQFAGIETFPVDSTWRFEARFIPYQPAKPIEVPNILGTVDTMLAPGYVEFMRDGRTYRLDPVLESSDSDEFFFIFKDGTSGTETYPPGRFLYTGLPVDGRVTIDFNRAYNPPCAFTNFATCPLPPEENALDLRVTAGEKMYRGH
jgi:uncharacterized protein (DUF1684 family)/dienelactone hydrolase